MRRDDSMLKNKSALIAEPEFSSQHSEEWTQDRVHAQMVAHRLIAWSPNPLQFQFQGI